MLRSRGRTLSSAARRLPSRLVLHDVTARDGIQNERTILDVDQKVELVRRLVACRPDSVEVCSFVREDLVPAMAGARRLCETLLSEDWAIEARQQGVNFAGLVPNMKGYESFRQASEAGAGEGRALDTVVCLVSCTDSHSKANVRMPLAQALETTCGIVEQAKKDGFRVRAYATLAFECPFEGIVNQDVVIDNVKTYLSAGGPETEIVLADTLGTATPEHVRELVTKVLDLVPQQQLALHLHNAHGRATENVIAAMKLGVGQFDAALGGAGGCNFVPDAKGNISTQQVIAAAEHLGVECSLDRSVVNDATAFLQLALGRQLDHDYNLPESM
mmetsp:Transcript_7578/g.13237  ORF Transcript_7578/g.13237 Transcript_7578/m.13237 type:complete len:331 (-) Transcript_7578:64-1056(-)